MLIEFSVQNYLSFKEKVTLSMLASKDKDHEDTNIITLENGNRYLKTAIIYGANASGKSNLLKSIDFMTGFVRSSHTMQIEMQIDVKPFKLDKEYANKPSQFDIIFINNNIKYAYGFSATQSEVIEEYLYYFPDEKQTTIFERSGDKYTFIDDIDEQNAIKKRNTVNKLYLSTAAIWNYEKVKDVFLWFSSFRLYNENLDAIFTWGKWKQGVQSIDLAKDWLKEIDVRISDIKMNTDEDFFYGGAFELLKRVQTTHNVTNADGSSSEINFSMMEESDGTRNFFLLSVSLTGNISHGHSFLIDELDTHLHPLLSRYIIMKYNNSKTNPSNAQLIFTTHDTSLLDTNLFRHDQIWFTEIKPDTSETDLYSLYDFDVRKDANIEKGYLIGKYGAIPFIGGDLNG